MSLGDFVTLQRGHDLPEPERRPGHVPVMGSFGLTGYHDTAKANGPGVTLGRSGASFGVVSYCPIAYWPLNTALYVTDFHGNDERFAYYLLKSLDFSGYNSGSAQPSLNRNHIYPMTIRVPPLVRQQAIARILGALDDKIDLNSRVNATLEAMARALFQAWFVDFEPVRAKAAGATSLPLMPKLVFEALPRRLIDSGETSIPEGWVRGTFGDIAINARNIIDPGQAETDTPYIGLEHMPRRSIALAEWGAADGLQSGKFRFQRGEILFGKLRPYFHKVGVAPLDGVCSTDIVVIRPVEPAWFGLVLGHSSSDDFVRYVDARSSGTKMPRTNWQDMAQYPVALPPSQLAEVFTNAVRPMIDAVIANIHESKTLAELRDTLLPKLLSGEVRVRP